MAPRRHKLSDKMRAEEKLKLHECALNGGDAVALMKSSYMRGLITEEQYKDFLEIDRMCKEDENA